MTFTAVNIDDFQEKSLLFFSFIFTHIEIVGTCLHRIIEAVLICA